MKIAQIAPIVERVPPKKYGGTERVVYALTEELVRLGHEVTLFASGDTITSARLVAVAPKSLREMKLKDPYGATILSSLNFGLAYQLQNEFDVIHDHMGTLSLSAANLSKTPVVMTYHGPFTQEVQDIYEVLNRPYVVSISKKQGSMTSEQMNHIGTVYNGLMMEDYPFSATTEDYLLFVGRITEEKGVHHAINVAKRLKMKLIIAAKLDYAFAPDIAYYEEKVKPFLDDKIQWIGEVNETERNELMKNAKAFLHPVTWPEPFGLTLIESMACGTPVVAFRLGSIPEVIADGKSGFVVETEEEMTEAVLKIGTIDRSFCREYALSQFSGKKMAEGYLKVYETVVEKQKQKMAAETVFQEKIMRMKLIKEFEGNSPTVLKDSNKRSPDYLYKFSQPTSSVREDRFAAEIISGFKGGSAVVSKPKSKKN